MYMNYKYLLQILHLSTIILLKINKWQEKSTYNNLSVTDNADILDSSGRFCFVFPVPFCLFILSKAEVNRATVCICCTSNDSAASVCLGSVNRHGRVHTLVTACGLAHVRVHARGVALKLQGRGTLAWK